MKIIVFYLIIAGAMKSQSTDFSQIKPHQNWKEIGMQMRLINDLDRPQDGWCLDVVGSGENIRFDMPLIGHNCKPGLYADEAVVHRRDSSLFFPAYGLCVTAMGLNQFVLPKASLMLKSCDHTIPFLDTRKFQKFEYTENSKVKLKGSNLCIVVGNVSEKTFDPTHRWRTLYMDDCDIADSSRTDWKFIEVENKK